MKKFLRTLLCLIALICASNSFSQSTGYMSIPDPSNNTSFVRMIRTSDNGFISLSISGNAGANHEIIKWDSNFHVEWTQNFAMAAVLSWNDVIETNDGNFIAMAANQNHSTCNIIIKLNSTGTILWQKEYYLAGNFLTSFAISKAAGNDPGFIFGGGACGASNYLVRCDANGNILWQKEYYITGASGVETVLTILPETNAYIITGYAGFSSDIDPYILKIDSASTTQWCKLIQEPVRPQVPSKCIKTAAGNYIMQCGYNSNPGYMQLFYYFDANGNVTNGVKLESPTQQQITVGGFAEVGSGRIILNGSVNAAPMSYLYMELNAYGAIVWQKKSVGVNATNDNGTGYTLAKTSNNLYALGGAASADGKTVAIIDSTGAGFCNSTTAAIVSNPPETYTVATTTPIIIATSILVSSVTNTATAMPQNSTTICGTVGLDQTEKNADELTIYPNPVSDKITLDFGGKTFSKAHITFYNMLGEKVSSSVLSSNSPTIDISGFPSGIYLMEVILNGERILKRIIKE